MKIISGGVTKPKGFKANGIYCGIKRSQKLDLSLIVSETPAVGAAVFTRNSIKAAPVCLSQRHIKNGKVQAFVTNSGNANCFTGPKGRQHALRTAQVFSRQLNIPVQNIIISSTGIIGRPLPIDKIEQGALDLVQGLSNSREAAKRAAEGILTTDTKSKEMTVSTRIGGKPVVIGACAKGSGMTAPNMATMLAFITTDAAITAPLLKRALRETVETSFNSISIDGCMSTNDMVAIMANGQAGHAVIRTAGKDFTTFCQALNKVCLSLAKQIVLDAEGASKFMTIQVSGARTVAQARQVGLAISNSNLVKTAVFGNNPNWGRVAAAVGSVGIPQVTEDKLKMTFSSFKTKTITISVNLNIGNAATTVYSSDLTYEYVRINVEYN